MSVSAVQRVIEKIEGLLMAYRPMLNKNRNKKDIVALAARFILPTLLFSSALTMAGTASAVEFTKPKAVVELFTSQGCSSCPPADAALKQMNDNGEILGLALHVDYWDRLGWKDTFASPQNTERQRAYAIPLNVRAIYTPQAIINGRTHVTGSKKVEILNTANSYAKQGKGLVIDINLTATTNAINVSIDQSEIAKHATLYAYYFNPASEVAIKRGENAGKKITYSNIVGTVETIGMVGDAGFDTEFSIADIRQKGYKGCALILQAKTADGGPGPILGATVISDL
ncbi:MAG: DUF1223 domain-containing protein [Salaquimonas sp.]